MKGNRNFVTVAERYRPELGGKTQDGVGEYGADADVEQCVDESETLWSSEGHRVLYVFGWFEDLNGLGRHEPFMKHFFGRAQVSRIDFRFD